MQKGQQTAIKLQFTKWGVLKAAYTAPFDAPMLTIVAIISGDLQGCLVPGMPWVPMFQEASSKNHVARVPRTFFI